MGVGAAGFDRPLIKRLLDFERYLLELLFVFTLIWWEEY